MAFNFNWSPLIADTTRARDMLTAALNKSPKPPIIVDDIIVNELNLGSTPPELEILEIGDLAEDRFRGIFKMSYTGDAYLTLGTRVQANPLNTYLSTKPAFASPRPLAANSSLTIPLQITLSDIRLSGFVILVFSRQKGITLVFRNDPLESLKVSSTFDSIPFVRNYLQKEIEGQLRVLFMEDLPAIIHRLSLKLWSPEYQIAEQQAAQREEEEDAQPIDPLASPPQNATEGFNDGLDSRFDLNSPSETYASFSQKNVLRLAALNDSQRTLSLFTPSIRDTVFRAWASPDANGASTGASTPLQRHVLSRLQSSTGISNLSSAASHTSERPSLVSHISEAPSARPSLASFASAPTTYSLNSGMQPRARAGRKRKTRVVNLRKSEARDGSDGVSVSSGYAGTASASASASGDSPSLSRETTVFSSETSDTSVSYAHEDDLATPLRSPRRKVGFHAAETPRQRPSTPRAQTVQDSDTSLELTPRAGADTRSRPLPTITKTAPQSDQAPAERPSRLRRPPLHHTKTVPNPSGRDAKHSQFQLVSPSNDTLSGGILEQAWMMKIAAGVEGRVAQEKSRSQSLSEGEERDAPPAYVS